MYNMLRVLRARSVLSVQGARSMNAAGQAHAAERMPLRCHARWPQWRRARSCANPSDSGRKPHAGPATAARPSGPQHVSSVPSTRSTPSMRPACTARPHRAISSLNSVSQRRLCSSVFFLRARLFSACRARTASLLRLWGRRAGAGAGGAAGQLGEGLALMFVGGVGGGSGRGRRGGGAVGEGEQAGVGGGSGRGQRGRRAGAGNSAP